MTTKTPAPTTVLSAPTDIPLARAKTSRGHASSDTQNRSASADTAFNLRILVEEIRQASGVVDPGELWPLVLQKIAPDDYRVALTETLPDFVRRVVRFPSGSEGQDDSPEPAKVSSIPKSGPPAQGGSWRRRAAQALRLRARGEYDGQEWRQLNDCDPDFLRAAAAFQDVKAEQTRAAAARRRHAADEMERRKAETIRDLPDDVVIALFGRAR